MRINPLPGVKNAAFDRKTVIRDTHKGQWQGYATAVGRACVDPKNLKCRTDL